VCVIISVHRFDVLFPIALSLLIHIVGKLFPMSAKFSGLDIVSAG